MQPSEYTISQFQPGDFKDPNGNTWCNVLFVEKSNEPLRIVVKDPSAYSIGMKVYGHIETKTSQAGKPYERFYRDQKPDANQQSFAPSMQAANAGVFSKQPYKDNSDGQRQGMCFNNAANFVNQFSTEKTKPDAWAKAVHKYANALYMLGDLGDEKAVTDLPKTYDKDAEGMGYDFERHETEAGLRADNIDPSELNGIFDEQS